eukprot:2391819-Prymnesium_polylepis.1
MSSVSVIGTRARLVYSGRRSCACKRAAASPSMHSRESTRWLSSSALVPVSSTIRRPSKPMSASRSRSAVIAAGRLVSTIDTRIASNVAIQSSTWSWCCETSSR